jgi:hypothetical protein
MTSVVYRRILERSGNAEHSCRADITASHQRPDKETHERTALCRSCIGDSFGGSCAYLRASSRRGSGSPVSLRQGMGAHSDFRDMR